MPSVISRAITGLKLRLAHPAVTAEADVLFKTGNVISVFILISESLIEIGKALSLAKLFIVEIKSYGSERKHRADKADYY